MQGIAASKVKWMQGNGLGGLPCAERRPQSYTLFRAETLEAEQGPDFAWDWTLDRTSLQARARPLITQESYNNFPFSITIKCSKNALITKKTKFFSYNKEIQMGAVAKSYMRKGFLIYEEMQKYFNHI